MTKVRSRAWRRAHARRVVSRRNPEGHPARRLGFPRKYLCRRRDKMFLRRKEGYFALTDDWS